MKIVYNLFRREKLAMQRRAQSGRNGENGLPVRSPVGKELKIGKGKRVEYYFKILIKLKNRYQNFDFRLENT